MAKKVCARCKKEAGLLGGAFWASFNDQNYCGDCAQLAVDEGTASVVATTTPSIEGHVIKRYIDIESVEVVIGTGVISEFAGDISDFFGARGGEFERKLQKGKQTALKKLKFLAFNKGGNAVVGIDLDYTEFQGNRVGIVANGTIVQIEKA